MNNKGFAVSTVLYTLLIAFLMFLGVTLAQFSTSSSLLGKANDDLINGTKLKANLVKGDNDRLIKISSRYGTMYWPIDFGASLDSNNVIVNAGENGKIKVDASLDSLLNMYKLTFIDEVTNESTSAYADWSINN